MSEVEVTIDLENVEEFKAALREFGPMFKSEMYSGLQRIANKEERELKSTAYFNDITGRSRRSLFVTATYNPLGLEMGSWLPHMKYLAFGHGTWEGNWWTKYTKGMIPRVTEGISDILNRLVRKYNNRFKGM